VGIEVLAFVALGVLSIAQLLVLVWVFRESIVERSALLDRIQAPGAAVSAAYESSLPGRDFPTVEDVPAPVENLSWDDDLQLIGSLDSEA